MNHKKYQVLEQNSPCDCHHHNVNESWTCSIFDNFESALSYAQAWCSPYINGLTLIVNVPYDFSGYGDFIEIREIV